MNPLIRWSYFIQILAIVGGAVCASAATFTILNGQYWLAALNLACVGINIHTIYSQRKCLKNLRNGFTKHAKCSCGACDWGTLTRQYDEVPICRNCWQTWKGK